METIISLDNLSEDQIVQQIKSLVADSTVLSISLLVERGLMRADDPIQQSAHDLTFKSAGLTLSSMGYQSNVNLSCQSQYSSDQSLLRRSMNQSTGDWNYDRRLRQALNHYSQANYNAAIQVFQEMLDHTEKAIAQKQNEKDLDELNRAKANITFHLGNCFSKTKQYKKAIQFYSIDLPQESERQKGLRKGNMGTCYAYQHQNSLSLSIYKEALRVLSEFSDIDLSNIYYNVGAIYLEEKMYETATKYLKCSVDERKVKSPDNDSMVFSTLFKLGVALRGMGKIDQSLNKFFIAQGAAERGVGVNNLSQVYGEIAYNYQLLEKWNDAFGYYQKMLDNLKTDDCKGKAHVYSRVGKIYINAKNYKEGLKSMKLAIAEHEKMGNYQKAAQIRQKYQNTLKL